jgi:hypothetical protein
MTKNVKNASVGPLKAPSKAKGGEWAVKVERAMQIRESSAAARRGKPMSFPTGMHRR